MTSQHIIYEITCTVFLISPPLSLKWHPPYLSHHNDSFDGLRPTLCVTSHPLYGCQLMHSTVTCQVPQSMGFSRQKYWSGLPCPPLGIFLTQGSNPWLLCLLHCRQILYPLSHLKSPSVNIYVHSFLLWFLTGY